jgi:Rieske 2Fe-2S family protein
MSIESPISPVLSDNITQTWATLPSHTYFDAARHERELEQIWYRNWLYVGRASELAQPRAYRTFAVGTQNIIILRDDDGALQAFHNACRHRGSVLCTEDAGQLSSRNLVCPYHQWSYNLQGKLMGVPFIGAANKLSDGDLSLYTVAVEEWGGCVFVNLAEGGEIRPFAQTIAADIQNLANWPLEELVLGHTYQTIINCNWKIFWENYQECYHCPGVHPELCDLVPLFKKGISSEALLPQASSLNPGVREGATTWSMDGLIHGEKFTDLSDEEKLIGYKYLTSLPTMFMAAHPDYVRIVSFYPLEPEKIQLTAEWLFPAPTLNHPDFDMQNVTEFAILVMEQDAKVCELNQNGLHSNRHRQGILVPHEYEVYQFHQWVRDEMGES